MNSQEPMVEPEVDPLDTFLIGKILDGGWKIEECREISRDAPSNCRTYLARNTEGHLAFVKVLDPRGLSSLAQQQRALDEFAYEDSIVAKCSERNMRRVVRGLASSQIMLPGEIPVPVRYLVFEWADRDVRSMPDQDPEEHTVSALRWLHHAATALQELHYSNIVHQDLKPANLLLMKDRSARVGDLGHAIDRIRPRPSGEVVEKSTWSPPEVLYGGFDGSFEARRAVDMYQLGSLVVFMFSSVGLTTRLSQKVAPLHHWHSWSGSYQDMLFYLRDYFGLVLDDWRRDVPEWLYADLREVVSQLSDPDPTTRGHPQNRAGAGARFGFERYVSRFDLLAKKASLRRKR